MVPKMFQHKRDDRWYPWISGHVDLTILRMKLKSSNGEPITVNGVTVYALKFENGAEWDVREGWKR